MAKTLKKPKPKMIRVPKEYAGEYVARRSWNSRKIIAHSKDPFVAYNDARRLGVKEPVLMFIRDPNVVYLF